MIRITFHGAAGGEVTGSCYLVETDGARVLVDAGLFQGGADADARNVLPPGLEPERLDAVLVTHAHLDHTGRVPLLIKHGYRGPIYMTEASIDLAEIILKDAAKLQAQDAVRTNRKRERAGEPPIEPLFGPEHVEPMREFSRPVGLHAPVAVAKGVRARFLEAGHILGSASLELTLGEGGDRKVVVFSGDLGPTTLPIVKEFEPPRRADLVVLESTYGDRDHRGYAETVAEFEEIVARVVARKGKILVPTFAIGRAQQILYHLALMFRAGKVRHFPVYLDSPMAIEATRVYRQYPKLFDKEMAALERTGDDPLDPGQFRASVTAEDSKKLNELEGPCAILAGAGMCTGGRILHHFKQNLWKADTHVLIVGYQARHSLGRQLVDKAESVSVFGERIAVRAQVHTLGGFSAHAGRSDLLKWFDAVGEAAPRVVLTHGEERPRQALADEIRRRYQITCELPGLGETLAV